MEAVTLIIPVFDEVHALDDTIRRCREVVARLPEGSRVLFVDDGSTDGSRERLRELAEGQEDAGVPLGAVFQPRNRGYGAALKRGVREALTPLVAICDADGTYPIEKLPAFHEELAREGAAMIIGARRAGETPPLRRPAKALLRWLAEYLTGERIPDFNSGLRLFRRRDALRFEPLLPDGFSYTTTITMALLTEGEVVLFRPIRYRPRVGTSKIRPLRDTAGFLLLICRTTLAFHPMKVFGPAGLALMGGGLLLLLLRLALDKPFGVATTIALLVGGIQLLAVGLLADLVNRRGQTLQPPDADS